MKPSLEIIKEIALHKHLNLRYLNGEMYLGNITIISDFGDNSTLAIDWEGKKFFYALGTPKKVLWKNQNKDKQTIQINEFINILPCMQYLLNNGFLPVKQITELKKLLIKMGVD